MLLSRLTLEVNNVKVEKINYVMIMVKDLEKASKFFADLFDTEFSSYRESKGADAKIVSSPLGIELFTPLSPDGPTARVLERRGQGMSVLKLKVSNLEEAVVDMESHGVKLVVRGEGPSGKLARFHPAGLHGVMIELVE